VAKIVFITDEEGVVRFERRPSPLKDVAITGKKIYDLTIEPIKAANPPGLALKYSELVGLVSEAEMSDRLSEEEKAGFRRLLIEFDPILDSVAVERRPGEFYRTHGVQAFDLGPGPPPEDRVSSGTFDP
jgi:hypothetical protein